MKKTEKFSERLWWAAKMFILIFSGLPCFNVENHWYGSLLRNINQICQLIWEYICSTNVRSSQMYSYADNEICQSNQKRQYGIAKSTVIVTILLFAFWCQFHQRFTRSFYARRSQKCKK